MTKPHVVNWLSQSWPWCLSGGLLIVPFLSELWLFEWLFLATVLLGLSCAMRRARLFIVAALLFVIGASWGSFWGERALNQSLPDELVKKDVWVSGFVQDLPQVRGYALRFKFRVTETKYEGSGASFKSDVLLNWYDKPYPDLKVGQQWALKVRLKPAHGSLNPGSFNYEQWLFSQGIRATGYVRESKTAMLLSQPGARHWFDQLRAKIKYFVDSRNLEMGGIIKALAIGERSDISEAQWRVFRATGTAHLIAISGLHIGLIAGIVYALVHILWRHTLLVPTLLPSQHVARLAALLAAGIYAALAGFSVPTVRALLMLVAYFMLTYLRRNPKILFTLGFVLMIVLIVDPLAPLGAGLWLSFGAVAAIAYAVGNKKEPDQTKHEVRPVSVVMHKVAQYLLMWARIQWVVFLFLMPLMLLFFGQFSIISLVANLIAIPLFGMIIVPMVLLSSLGVSLGLVMPAEILLSLANDLIILIWPLMQAFSALPFAVWQGQAPALWAMLVAIIAAIILLSPRMGKIRMGAALGFLPLFLSHAKSLEPDTFELEVLDVGQGLAVVVRTAQHALVYDAGIKYPAGFDSGRVIVVPYLQQSGLQGLDMVIASHQNIDHYGGLDAVLEIYPVDQRYSSAAFIAQSLPCEHGISWVWDGVVFTFLHPEMDNQSSDNNDSCVLSIRSRYGSALLTGDIELEAEQNLVRTEAARLRADVLLVPHHGSRTSSSDGFIDQVNPGLAVISAGYLSRFKHPHDDIVQRYRRRDIAMLNTATAGAIQIKFDAQGVSAQAWRSLQKRYWLARFKAAKRVVFTPE